MTNVPAASTTCLHVLDVAEAHIKALHLKIKGGSKYLPDGIKASWQDVVDIVQRDYAKVKADIPAPSWPTETKKAETELGMKWRGLEQMVREVMDQELGLLKQ